MNLYRAMFRSIVLPLSIGNVVLAQPVQPPAVATEEHDLLHSLGVAPPYILVGHSIGGL